MQELIMLPVSKMWEENENFINQTSHERNVN